MLLGVRALPCFTPCQSRSACAGGAHEAARNLGRNDALTCAHGKAAALARGAGQRRNKSTLAGISKGSYPSVMQNTGFEEAFTWRIDDMLDACTRCGACFTACPIAAPAGLDEADPTAVIDGVLDIVRLGTGPDASQKWAKACMQSGECIKACHYGVNPRFLLAVARVQIAKHANEPPDRRKQGVQNFRKMAEDVGVLARLQLSDEALERLGQKPTAGRFAGIA